MFRIVSVLVLALSLGACANIGGKSVFLPTLSVANPLGPQSLVDIKAAYALAATGAAAYIDRYRAGHRCTRSAPESLSNICSRRSIVLRLQQADRVAQAALGRATAFVTDNPTIDASDVLSAARDAVAAFSAVQKGV